MTDFTIANAVARVRSEGDLFKGVLSMGIDMPKILRKTARTHPQTANSVKKLLKTVE